MFWTTSTVCHQCAVLSYTCVHRPAGDQSAGPYHQIYRPTGTCMYQLIINLQACFITVPDLFLCLIIKSCRCTASSDPVVYCKNFGPVWCQVVQSMFTFPSDVFHKKVQIGIPYNRGKWSLKPDLTDDSCEFPLQSDGAVSTLLADRGEG